MKATEIEPILSDASLSVDEKTRAILNLVPGQKTIDQVWTILIWVVAIISLLALLGIIWTVVDGKASTSPDILVGLFTTAFAGLLGLFINPSTSRSG